MHCRVDGEVAHPGPSPDPDKEIATIRLFRRCVLWLLVSTTFTSLGDMCTNVRAWGRVEHPAGYAPLLAHHTERPLLPSSHAAPWASGKVRGFGAASPWPTRSYASASPTPVTEAGARLTTGAGGLTLRRTGFALAGRRTTLHEGIATSNSLWPALPGRTKVPIRRSPAAKFRQRATDNKIGPAPQVCSRDPIAGQRIRDMRDCGSF